MPRTVPPPKWRSFMRLYRQGYTCALAARAAGISPRTAARFLTELRQEQAGGLSQRRSSGWLMVALEAAEDMERPRRTAS